MDLKPQLLKFVDAYGAARSTGNNELINMSAAALQQFLSAVELQPVQKQDGLTPEAVPATPEPEPEAPVQEAA